MKIKVTEQHIYIFSNFIWSYPISSRLTFFLKQLYAELREIPDTRPQHSSESTWFTIYCKSINGLKTMTEAW